MKKYLIPLVLLVFFAGTSCHHQEKIDNEKEKEAILALITEETNAYHDKDFERFAECYVQNETNIRILGGEGEKISYTVGWEKVGSDFKEWFENNPDPTPNNEVKKNFPLKFRCGTQCPSHLLLSSFLIGNTIKGRCCYNLSATGCADRVVGWGKWLSLLWSRTLASLTTVMYTMLME